MVSKNIKKNCYKLIYFSHENKSYSRLKNFYGTLKIKILTKYQPMMLKHVLK